MRQSGLSSCSAESLRRVSWPVYLVLTAAICMSGCTMGGGGHGGGQGAANHVIDLTMDVTVNSQPDGPNLTFTLGTNAMLHFAISNSGNQASDQLVTLTVTLPGGISFASSASVNGNWTCNASGQTITCTSSASVPGLTNGLAALTMNVSVANNAAGPTQLQVSVSTPDGSPSTSSGAKGVNFVAAAPSITSLNPNSGSVGTAVTISGSNFGSSQGASTVNFNGTAATKINSWSNAAISANVPCGTTTGNVVVTVGGAVSNGMNFTVNTTPAILSLSPNSGPAGTTVTISGCNFGSSQGTSTVTINGANAGSASSWSATSIKINVPSGATSGNVVVTVGGVASNGLNFTVTTAAGCNVNAGNATALLTGDYAFSGQGVSQAHFFAFVGRFHSDGLNTLSNGLIEQNEVSIGSDYTPPITFSGCFQLNTPAGASGVALGTLTINSASPIFGGLASVTLAVAIQTNGDGRLINYGSSDPQVSGAIEKQCPAAANATCPAFSNSNVSGDYAFGFAGILPGSAGSNFAAAGRLNSSGDAAGDMSNAVLDMSSFAGLDATNDGFTASYSTTDTTNGRAVITANVTYNGPAGGIGSNVVFQFGCYLARINSGVAAVLYCVTTNGTSQGPPVVPLLHGRFISQSTPTGGWTNANAVPATGASVGYGTGIDGSGTPRTAIFQVNSWNPSANPPTVMFNLDLNKGGSVSFQTATLDYSVAANGRIQISNPATSPPTLLSVGYLNAPGGGFTVDVANNATLSFFEQQESEPAGGFTSANFDNSYAFGTQGILESGVSDIDGVITSTGSTQTFSGVLDVNGSSGPASGNTAGSYTVASTGDAAIGRLTVNVTQPTADTDVVYIIDSNTAVGMSITSGEPAIVLFKH